MLPDPSPADANSVLDQLGTPALTGSAVPSFLGRSRGNRVVGASSPLVGQQDHGQLRTAVPGRPHRVSAPQAPPHSPTEAVGSPAGNARGVHGQTGAPTGPSNLRPDDHPLARSGGTEIAPDTGGGILPARAPVHEGSGLRPTTDLQPSTGISHGERVSPQRRSAPVHDRSERSGVTARSVPVPDGWTPPLDRADPREQSARHHPASRSRAVSSIAPTWPFLSRKSRVTLRPPQDLGREVRKGPVAGIRSLPTMRGPGGSPGERLTSGSSTARWGTSPCYAFRNPSVTRSEWMIPFGSMGISQNNSSGLKPVPDRPPSHHDREQPLEGRSGPGPRVHDHHASETVPVPHGVARPDRPAPILHHQHQVRERQVPDQLRDHLGVLLRRESIPGRCLGHPKTGVIQGDQATLRPQALDDVPIEVGPRRVAVKQQHWGSLSLVHVVNEPVAVGKPVIRKWILRGIDLEGSGDRLHGSTRNREPRTRAFINRNGRRTDPFSRRGRTRADVPSELSVRGGPGPFQPYAQGSEGREALTEGPRSSFLDTSGGSRGSDALRAGPAIVPLQGPAEGLPAPRDRAFPLRPGGVLAANTVRAASRGQYQLGPITGDLRERVVQGVGAVASHRVRMPAVGREKADDMAAPEPASLRILEVLVDHLPRGPSGVRRWYDSSSNGPSSGV